MMKIKFKQLIEKELDKKPKAGDKFIGDGSEFRVVKPKSELGDKFFGDGTEFRLVSTVKQNVKQSTQKILVTNKKTGSSYEISKPYYEKHKQNYTISKENKFVGDGGEFKSAGYPKDYQQFMAKYSDGQGNYPKSD